MRLTRPPLITSVLVVFEISRNRHLLRGPIGCRGRRLALASGYFVADRHLVFPAAVSGGRVPRADDAAFGIGTVDAWVMRFGIQIGGKLNTRVARTDHRSDDRLHLLLAQPLLERDLPFVGADIAAVRIVGGAVGQQVARLVDDRDALRAQLADGAAMRWRMARTCCGSSAPRTLSTIEADGSTLSRRTVDVRASPDARAARGRAHGWCAQALGS